VIAWSVAVAIILYLLAIEKRLLSLNSGKQGVLSASKKILKIGFPAAGANMLTPLAMAVMTAIVAGYGPEAVAAFGVGSRIESIASLVVLALSMTLPPFVSQNYGAGKYERVQQAYKKTLQFVLIWQFVIYLVLLLFSSLISRTFGNEPQVVRVIELFIYIMPLSYGLQGVIILSNSSFNALHKPMNALALSVVRLFIFYVPFAYAGSLFGGLTGLFIGAAIGNFVTALVAFNWFNSSVAKMHNASAREYA
jgi:Na+-driven multidrug efflux pump